MSAVIHAFPAADAQPDVDDLVADLGLALGDAHRAPSIDGNGGPTRLVTMRPDAHGVVDDLVLAAPLADARRNVVALVVAVLAVALLAAGAILGPDGSAAAQPSGTTVVVAPGETLWDLAERIVPAGQDPRPTIRAIRAVNDLTPGPLQAGAILDLPTVD